MGLASKPMNKASPMRHLFVFKLCDGEFAVELSHVREVHPYSEPFPIPCPPPCIVGVMNLRGRAVPVVDLKALLGVKCGCKPYRIVVAEVEGHEFIFAIDSQGEDMLVPQDAIQQPPPSLPERHRQLIIGIISLGGRTITLLNLHPSRLWGEQGTAS